MNSEFKMQKCNSDAKFIDGEAITCARTIKEKRLKSKIIVMDLQ